MCLLLYLFKCDRLMVSKLAPNPSIPGYGGIFSIVEIQFERWSDLNRLKRKNDNH